MAGKEEEEERRKQKNGRGERGLGSSNRKPSDHRALVSEATHIREWGGVYRGAVPFAASETVTPLTS